LSSTAAPCGRAGAQDRRCKRLRAHRIRFGRMKLPGVSVSGGPQLVDMTQEASRLVLKNLEEQVAKN